MSRWSRVALAAVIPLMAFALLAAGLTNSYGTGSRLDRDVGAWVPDGAAADTFWDSPIIDVPGLSVYTVHCHGRMRLDVQLGATAPPHSNPCYAALGAYGGGNEQTDLYLLFPNGNTALFRHSTGYGPWTYSIGDVIRP